MKQKKIKKKPRKLFKTWSVGRIELNKQIHVYNKPPQKKTLQHSTPCYIKKHHLFNFSIKTNPPHIKLIGSNKVDSDRYKNQSTNPQAIMRHKTNTQERIKIINTPQPRKKSTKYQLLKTLFHSYTQNHLLNYLNL
jgi:hypothetical protein